MHLLLAMKTVLLHMSLQQESVLYPTIGFENRLRLFATADFVTHSTAVARHVTHLTVLVGESTWLLSDQGCWIQMVHIVSGNAR